MNEGNNGVPIIVGLIIVLIIAGGVWWAVQSRNSATPYTDVTQNSASSTDSTTYGNTSGDQGSNASGTSQTGATNTGSSGAGTSNSNTGSSPMAVTIFYTDNGFSPANVTIPKGGTVTWVDQTSSPFWVASGQHPIHSGYDGTTEQQHCAPGYTGPAPFDECSSGTSFSFTFDKVGSWPYHNHLDASDHGVVTVTE